jgi:GST-like protein
MITLHGMGSPNVLKVLLLLEETGLAYRFQRCDVILGEQHQPAFRAMNPNGRVPVIEDDAGPGGAPAVLFESGAILIYLAEKAGQFLPAGGPDRYRALEWLMFQMGGVGPTFGHMIHLTSFAASEPYACARFGNEARRLLQVIETRLGETPHLAGADYSIADMALFPWVNTMERFLPAVNDHPALVGWRDRVAARPAAERVARLGQDLAAQDRQSFKTATQEQLDRYFGRVRAGALD